MGHELKRHTAVSSLQQWLCSLLWITSTTRELVLKKLLIALDTKYSDRERKLELMIASFAPLDVFSSKKEKRQKEKKKQAFHAYLTWYQFEHNVSLKLSEMIRFLSKSLPLAFVAGSTLIFSRCACLNFTRVNDSGTTHVVSTFGEHHSLVNNSHDSN